MTTSQRQTERHQTSVFSEYENNSNNSISSKQLELWLQQMAPTSHNSPKFGQEWNLMSTSSRYESDGLTFGARMDTFESANKENILNKANYIIEPSKSTDKQNHQSFCHPQNLEKLKSSKSYINAMQELQKRAKTLEQDNTNMRKSLQIFQEEKRNSLHSSMMQSQEMRSKILKFEQTQKRIQEMKKENKKLRDSKNEQSLKVKLMQKSIHQQKVKVKAFEQRLEMLSKENQDIKRQLIESNNLTKSLMMENKQLALKTETLENMKEKSTNSILEKYAKALERIQELELTHGELKTKITSMEDKHKKSIEEKDGKYWSSLEAINELKLEKEQLSIRLSSFNGDFEEKSKLVHELQEKLKLLGYQCSQQSKQIFSLKNILSVKDEKLLRIAQKYSKMRSKYTQMKEKLKQQQHRHMEQMKNAKQINLKVQNEQSEVQSEQESVDEQNVIEITQKNETKTSYFVGQKNAHKILKEDTPVQRYDQTSPGNEITELEEFTTLAKPLSIIANAKNSQARIKSEEDQVSSNHDDSKESEEQDDDFANQRYISLNKKQDLSEKQNISQPKKESNRKSAPSKKNSQERKNKSIQKSKEQREQQSKSKDSVKSTQSRKKSLRELKYMIPASNFNKNKKSTTITHNKSSLSSSHNRSKSSSVEKKKTTQKKSISVESKRNSSFQQRQRRSNGNSDQQQNSMITLNEPCQSRYINEKPQQIHMYMSAQPTRYPNQHPEHYYYTNEVNVKRNFDEQQKNLHEPFYQQNASTHNHSIIGRSQSEVKRALNKALLLEYQEEALKLYEEHQKLLGISENQNISTQEKAEILGRIRQVMNMIDHNTEKIFNLKGKSE